MTALRGTPLGTVALPPEPERAAADETPAGGGLASVAGRAKRALNGDSDDELGMSLEGVACFVNARLVDCVCCSLCVCV